MLPSLAPELHSPERLPFIKKLRAFIEDHSLDEIPTLVIQCEALDAKVADITSRTLQQAMLQGAGQSSVADWWSGFMAGSTQTVFDGLATKGDRSEPWWVTELHDDGHVLAGIRLKVFPDLEGVHPAILDAFGHFALLVKNLHAAAAVQAKLKVTATVANARGLGFLTFPRVGPPRVRKLSREFLEWPVLQADNAEGLSDVCLKMRAQCQRVFP